MSEKQNGNIFDTFETSLALHSILSVKLHFTKSYLVAIFLIKCAQNQEDSFYK